MYGKVCKNAPSFLAVIIMAAISVFILSDISLKRIYIKDLDWTDEE